jgi:filamentous hemagglutinin
LSSGIQLENFSAVTVNGIKAYKNLKTGKIIYATDFVAASGIESTNKGISKVTDFEKEISKMSPNDRVAAVKTEVNSIVNKRGLIKDNKLSKINNRDVYQDPNTGELYAVDTQHGRSEKINSKNGKHLGEVNFDFNPTKSADKSGGHDLKLKQWRKIL